MKKIILLAVITVSVTSAACRKQRTCDCKTTTTSVRTGNNPKITTGVTSEKTTTEKQKKKDFKLLSDCFSKKGTDSYSGGSGSSAFNVDETYETICELK